MVIATDCECEQGGWCVRHHCWKPGGLQRLCQHNPALFTLWEQGKGPGQLALLLAAHHRTGACAFRQSVVEERLCSTCAGNVRMKVFGCLKVQTCTLLPKFENIVACSECELFEAPTEQI